MSTTTSLQQFEIGINSSLADGSFIKISLGNYKGSETDLKNIYVRVIQIKRVNKLSFTFRYKTRDVVKNYSYDEGVALVLEYVSAGFAMSTLFTSSTDLSLVQKKEGVDFDLIKKTASLNIPPLATHNKEKVRLVPAGVHKKYLHELNITDARGEVFKNAQDKYKQINQYISLLSPLLQDLKNNELQHVVDMGSGKGYLTFALYDYLHNVLNLDTKVTGVEYRPDLVDLCNRIAVNAEFKSLNFKEGTIQDFTTERIDLLIALHACDTATDDAIFKGIMAGARLIVVAPCCHKQIRKEMTSSKTKNELSFVTKHGIFLERQGEMVTDGIRALILEYFGYKTKVMEFISGVHTPKNVLVIGIKHKQDEAKKREVLEKIKVAKAYFGIGQHYLESLCNLPR
ncbi:SAM-dependent methyltransferase [Pedobacter sp. CAN_A7]|uniref:class I SAM-dependent methyltransferase n=1 Tax=Pedobacter sp. CAN_A7 TaxID=2787722 RepID=UPI0018C9D21A